MLSSAPGTLHLAPSNCEVMAVMPDHVARMVITSFVPWHQLPALRMPWCLMPPAVDWSCPGFCALSFPCDWVMFRNAVWRLPPQCTPNSLCAITVNIYPFPFPQEVVVGGWMFVCGPPFWH